MDLDPEWRFALPRLGAAAAELAGLRSLGTVLAAQRCSARVLALREAAALSTLAGGPDLEDLLLFEGADGLLARDGRVADLSAIVSLLERREVGPAPARGVLGRLQEWLLCLSEPEPAWGRLPRLLQCSRLPGRIAGLTGLHEDPWMAPLLESHLFQLSLDPGPLCGLSCAWLSRRETRERLLRGGARTREAWTLLYLDAVEDQARDGTRRIQELLRLHGQHREFALAQGHGARTAFKASAFLFRHPLTTPRTLAVRLAISAPTALKSLAALAEAGLVEEITGRRSGRIYAATDLVELARGPAASPSRKADATRP